MRRFEGKTILVTGAASGIGFASAEQFAREGGIVIETDLHLEDLGKAFGNLRAEGLDIETGVQDVTDQQTWVHTVESVLYRRGRLDVLFNNAGGDRPSGFVSR